ncbi:hypothetical protein CsSME_00000286 [Camellia sinensis var. sinensis]
MAISSDHHNSNTFLFHSLNSKTPFIRLRLYLVIGLCFVCLIIVLVLILLWLHLNQNLKRYGMRVKHSSGMLPLFYKNVSEIKYSNRVENCKSTAMALKKKKKKKDKGERLLAGQSGMEWR